MSEEQRVELYLKAGKLIQSLLPINVVAVASWQYGIYDVLREELGYVGYAHYYLQKCWDKSESKNKAYITIYKQLLEIDSKLGTSQTEQLFKCVQHSLRMDLIKV